MAVRFTKGGLQSYDPKTSPFGSAADILREKGGVKKKPAPSPNPIQPSAPGAAPKVDAAAIKEGNAYIRQREKLAAKAGITPSQAARYLVPGEQQATVETRNIQNAAAAQALLNEPMREAAAPEATLGASLAGAGPDILASVATGAAIGAVGGVAFGGVGAIPGAVIGGIAGGIRGVLTSLKDEERQNVKVYRVTASESKNNIKTIINGVNAGMIDPIDATRLYRRELIKINEVERNLRLMSERDWLTKAKDELVKIQDFNSWERDYTEQLLLESIATPNPVKVLTMEQIQENVV